MGAAVAPRSRAAVRAIGASRFTRVQAPPDDVLRLEDGTIVLEVAPLPSGERFRVTTEDGEVEVRGTRFQVSASRGKLTQVTVASGRVEVRSAGGGRVVLDPGDEWVSGAGEINGRGATSKETREAQGSRPGEAESTGQPIGPPVRSRPARSAAGSTLVAPAAAPSIPPKAARASFDRAWSVLRQGDAPRAAALFAEVERTSGDSDIAEDALYWRSVATARAGDRPEARALFERFLRLFPASSRTGAAATALGWLYVENAQNDEARQAFERAMGDPSPAVRASARDGLRRASHP
jgi:TolA-binding protein